MEDGDAKNSGKSAAKEEREQQQQNLCFTDASEKLRTRSVRSFLDPLLGKKKERKRGPSNQAGGKNLKPH